MRWLANTVVGLFMLLCISGICWVIALGMSTFGFESTEAFRFFAFLGKPAVFVISHTDEAIDWIAEQ